MADEKISENIDNRSKFELGRTTIERFVQAAQSFNSYDRQPRQYGTEDTIYMSEAYFIQAISRSEKPEIGKIAEALGVTAGAASQTAAKLEDKGLIRRIRSSEDSRVVLVQMTERAKKLNAYHDELDFREYAKLGSWMTEFSEEEIEAIYRFLGIMVFFFKENPENIMNDWTYTPEGSAS